MEKKEDIVARLTVNNIEKMSEKDYLSFRKWLSETLQEFNREEKEVFNQKRYRATMLF